MDDTFLVFNEEDMHKDINRFIKRLNDYEENIKFTMEEEKDGRINFLDVSIEKGKQKITTSVYRKPTQTAISILSSSNHHPSQIMANIHYQIHRAIRYCSNKNKLKEEKSNIYKIADINQIKHKDVDRIWNKTHKKLLKEKTASKLRKENENQTESKWKCLPYIKGITDILSRKLNKEGIKTAFKSNRTIKNLIWNSKQKNDKLEQGGIYKIGCECGKNYIGITERKLSTRVPEHKRCVKNFDTNNALAIHCRQDCEKKILWDDIK